MSRTGIKILGKAVTVLGILAVVSGLFGCNKEPKPARHSISDISAVSISCGHMDFNYSYSFLIHREKGKWLFDADCFTADREVKTAFENREVSSRDIDALFEILRSGDKISYAENYKKPKKPPFEVMDETVYGFCLKFSDGSIFSTNDAQPELEDFFLNLAEREA
ncbi:MAG: hypothetical protein ACI4GA_06395 [Acutalibacteraceae bacterium]|nr:hypothetical protein [Oscillospiraceae bacterium]